MMVQSCFKKSPNIWVQEVRTWFSTPCSTLVPTWYASANQTGFRVSILQWIICQGVLEVNQISRHGWHYLFERNPYHILSFEIVSSMLRRRVSLVRQERKKIVPLKVDLESHYTATSSFNNEHIDCYLIDQLTLISGSQDECHAPLQRRYIKAGRVDI